MSVNDADHHADPRFPTGPPDRAWHQLGSELGWSLTKLGSPNDGNGRGCRGKVND